MVVKNATEVSEKEKVKKSRKVKTNTLLYILTYVSIYSFYYLQKAKTKVKKSEIDAVNGIVDLYQSSLQSDSHKNLEQIEDPDAYVPDEESVEKTPLIHREFTPVLKNQKHTRKRKSDEVVNIVHN